MEEIAEKLLRACVACSLVTPSLIKKIKDLEVVLSVRFALSATLNMRSKEVSVQLEEAIIKLKT